MSRTIKIIFLKENDYGLLLEGQNLNDYNTMYKQALQLYKMKHGPIEIYKGTRRNIKIETVKKPLTSEEKVAPTIGIIFVKDDKTAIFLTGEGFHNYQETFFTGKKLLKTKFAIKGKQVRVTLT